MFIHYYIIGQSVIQVISTVVSPTLELFLKKNFQPLNVKKSLSALFSPSDKAGNPKLIVGKQ